MAAVWWAGDGFVAVLRGREMQRASGEAMDWGRTVVLPNMSSSLLWIPLTVMALWLAERYPLGRRAPRAAVVHLLGLGIAIIGRALGVVILNPWVRWYPDQVPPLPELLLTSVFNNLFFYGLLTFAAHAVHYARQYRLRERELARAELQALRTQVRPHFLFNTLNAIASLVAERPSAAERMIAELGTLLRASLRSDGALRVPLQEELELVRAYLGIEQVRFGDRLSAEWDIEAEIGTALVPALLLQPLVENAVRHGLWPRDAPGRVRIAAYRAGGELRVTVEDDGVGLPSGGVISEGVGLANTRARLRQLYGGRHGFELSAGPDGRGVSVRIALPYRALGALDGDGYGEQKLVVKGG